MGGQPRYPFPRHVYSPAGGWWSNPKAWKWNTANIVAMMTITLIIPAFLLSAEREVKKYIKTIKGPTGGNRIPLLGHKVSTIKITDNSEPKLTIIHRNDTKPRIDGYLVCCTQKNSKKEDNGMQKRRR